MSKILTAAALVFAAGSIATADTISHDLVINPGGEAYWGPGYVTFDLLITVIGDDWTTSGATAVLTEGEFIHNSNSVPSYGFWDFVPDLQWGTFYTTTGPEPFKDASFPPGSPVAEPQLAFAEWFDAPPNGGDVTDHVLARYTIYAPGWDGTYSLGTVSGVTATVGDATLRPWGPFEFIPAPGTVALLGLAGLVSRRRR